MSASMSQETYLTDDNAGIAKIYDFLEAHEAAGREQPAPRYFLAGASSGDQVEIPEEIHRVLRQVIESMQRGLAVTVAPQSKTLTTQQTADLLSVSRPTVVKLLDSGDIPFERTGTHRRILLTDVLAFRERRRRAQYDALEEMSAGVDEKMPIDEVLSELRAARRTVAAKRRAAKAL